jgi:hypothetical protein
MIGFTVVALVAGLLTGLFVYNQSPIIAGGAVTTFLVGIMIAMVSVRADIPPKKPRE